MFGEIKILICVLGTSQVIMILCKFEKIGLDKAQNTLYNEQKFKIGGSRNGSSSERGNQRKNT